MKFFNRDSIFRDLDCFQGGEDDEVFKKLNVPEVNYKQYSPYSERSSRAPSVSGGVSINYSQNSQNTTPKPILKR